MTSATGIWTTDDRRRLADMRQAGFTLLEILVVVMLIGIILSVAVLSTGGDTRERVATEARRLQALFALAQEEAILGRRQLSARIRPDGVEFQVLEGKQWQPWQEAAVLRPRRFPPGMTVRLLQDERTVPLDAPEGARILFTSSGETMAFELVLGWEFEDFAWRLSGDEAGALQLSFEERD